LAWTLKDDLGKIRLQKQRTISTFPRPRSPYMDLFIHKIH
jgi:hypothetical protein